MQPNQLITTGEYPMLILTHDILEKLGVKVGANLRIKSSVEGGAIVIRLIDDIERKQKLDAAMEELLERRDNLYRRLAEGVQ